MNGNGGYIKLGMVVVGGSLLALTLGPKLWHKAFENYTGVVNAPLRYDSSQAVSEREFNRLADKLTRQARQERALRQTEKEEHAFARRLKVNMLMNTRSFNKEAPFPHIGYFREAGIRQYEGPATCLKCHETMKVSDDHGKVREVGTLDDVLDTVHFTFQSKADGFTTYGYDGRQVNGNGSRAIPVGKVDRACGIPGSFTWTGWADLVKTYPGEKPGGSTEVTRSEGCGQCHIGGNYHPATEAMMPVGQVPNEAKQGVDCLICHSAKYDMNQRYVIQDQHGRRWNQDRSLEAALTVGQPGRDNCLFCHQHNLGGDIEAALADNAAPRKLGHENQRLLHPGAKRGTSVMAGRDVHGAANMACTDCHVPQGHRIPRGAAGVDLVANDLPGRVVSCESCHTAAPHVKDTDDRALLNGHVDRLACEACHVKELSADNVVLRDWLHPTWNAEEGVWVYTDILRSGKARVGMQFLWFNGNGTFLANALGNHPLGGEGYDPFMGLLSKITDAEAIAQVRQAAVQLKQRYPEIDVDDYVRRATDPLSYLTPQQLAERAKVVEANLRPLMEKGKSKLTPFKVFNALMYEDLGNQGPFGGMILPFDYPTYYEKGDPAASVVKALSNPLIRRMYEAPFKLFMMDEFMKYFGVKSWNTTYPMKDGKLDNVAGRWMRQMGTLMVNHGVTEKGRGCKECHSASGIITFEQLGYPPERAAELRKLPELR
ncbi:MAG: nitrite reductase [Magnetococcales bacterium]|nr:nitrite reductase [Magnetococcales bacterium]